MSSEMLGDPGEERITQKRWHLILPSRKAITGGAQGRGTDSGGR